MTNPNVVTDPVVIPRRVALDALDAIKNDPRRHPYGHHQHGRGEAIQALRRALGDLDA